MGAGVYWIYISQFMPSTQSSATPVLDAQALVAILTIARKRRGWSVLRLSVEAGVPYFTAKRLRTGRIGLTTALKLAAALELTIQAPYVLTAAEANQGNTCPKGKANPARGGKNIVGSSLISYA